MDATSENPHLPKKPNLLNFVEFGATEIITVVIFLALLFGSLNYFNIIRVGEIFPSLNWLPHRITTEELLTQGAGSISTVPTKAKKPLVCPVPDAFCRNGKQITYNNSPALFYSLPAGTKVKNIARAVSFESYFVQPYKKENPKGFYQTYIIGENCYTATYTMASDVSVKKIDLLPIEAGTDLATVSAKTFPVNGQNVSFLLQIQKKVMDPASSGKPDFLRCTTTNLRPESKFGEYQKISIEMFE